MAEKKFEAVDPQEDLRKQQLAKASFTYDVAEIEKNLTNYLQMVDPIFDEDKKTVIAVVKRPTMAEMKALVPPEMQKYAAMDPKDIPKDVMEQMNIKYEDFYFEKMSEMIVAPKLSAAEWKAKANPWFLQKFWSHIESISELASGKVETFLEQPKGET